MLLRAISILAVLAGTAAAQPRSEFSLALLHDTQAVVALDANRMVFVGIDAISVCELAEQRCSRGAAPGVTRRHLTAALLPGGRVLVAGGRGDFTQAGVTRTGTLASAAIYDVAKNRWSPAASMMQPREMAKALALRDGRVLVVGGLYDKTDAFEVYDPKRNTWTGGIMELRNSVAFSEGADGRVLATTFNEAWTIDPKAVKATKLAGPGEEREGLHWLLRFPGDRVLRIGGYGYKAGPSLSSELFEQKAWRKASALPERYAPAPGSQVVATYGATAVVVSVSDPPGSVPRHVVMRYDVNQDRWTRDDKATIAVDGAMLMPRSRLYVVGTAYLVAVSDQQAQIFATR